MESLKLDKIYEQYEKEYENIFKYISPAKIAERFTEENQTLNFYNAVRSIYPETVAWFEYPWKVKGVTSGDVKSSSKRFDAVIYVKEINAMLIVESKCLRYDSKYKAINKDFCRILGCNYTDNNNIQSFTTSDKIIIRTNQITPTNVYSVILADYWNKPSAKSYKNIQNFWTKEIDNKSGYELFDKFKENIEKAKINRYIDAPDWKVIPKGNETFPNKYYLLTLIAKINNPDTIYDFIQE